MLGPSGSTLSRRERQIMEIVVRLGRASVADVMARLTGDPAYSTVRAQLRVLEQKGHLRHEEQNLRYVYLPTLARHKQRQSALKFLVETFFEGSPEQARAARPHRRSDRTGQERRDTQVIKASVLLTVMFCLSGALRRRSASERHLAWVIVLALASVLPILSLILPSWQPDTARRAAAVFPVLFQSSVPAEGRDADDVIVRAESLDDRDPPVARLLTLVWLGGVGLVMVVIIQASRRLAQGAAAARPIAGESWAGLVADVSRALGSQRSLSWASR